MKNKIKVGRIMRKLKILVIDDENIICWSFKKRFAKQGFDVITAETGEKGLALFEKHDPEIVFIDNKLPSMQGLEVLEKIKQENEETFIVFMTAYGTIEKAVKAMKLGAFEYLNKPYSFEEVELILENIKNKIKMDNEVQLLRRQQKDILTFDHIIGKSAVIHNIIRLVKKITDSEASTILLLGESGTGKDLLAKVIHHESNRKDKPFVIINCASLSETLLESELFGHERGAFTDAHSRKKGLIEIADGGTVFLDEIGATSLSVQAKLLGIIENKTFRRLGGTKDLIVNIRIIAATNKDLEKSVNNASFREDLYYRLKVFKITLPPLRKHKKDIPLLIDYFIESFNNQFRKNIRGITKEAENFLMEYDWPGNVRELRNVIERAIILESAQDIQKESLPAEIRNGVGIRSNIRSSSQFEIPETGFSLSEFEKMLVKQALIRTNNNQSQAARILGITRDSLRYRKKKYHL